MGSEDRRLASLPLLVSVAQSQDRLVQHVGQQEEPFGFLLAGAQPSLSLQSERRFLVWDVTETTTSGRWCGSTREITGCGFQRVPNLVSPR
jgi:hypothetical protein